MIQKYCLKIILDVNLYKYGYIPRERFLDPPQPLLSILYIDLTASVLT